MERRKIALLILNEYESEKTYLNLALKNGLSKLKEGRSFVTELVYGVVRYKRFLDEKISRYSTTKLKKLSIPVKNILRIGFYQIYFMDKIPDFAIINESVKLSEKYAYKSKSLVNAVLRKGVLKTEEEFPLSVRESFPDEVCQLIEVQYGGQTEEILHLLNQKVPPVLRYNHLRYQDVSQAAQKLENATVFEDALLPNVQGNLIPLIENGDFTVQSLSSQMAVRVLEPKPGERVLDCCSAPGGKTAFIGELMKNQGELVACELHPHRCELVKKNLDRCGISIGVVQQADATSVSFQEKFDKILADVPCSGLGVIGSKPDIKWRDFQFAQLTALQAEILENISQYLKKDGTLIYSTCTINRQENEYQIERFLAKHPEFSPEPFSIKIQEKTYGEHGMAGILPNGMTIGFFIAKLRKTRE